MEWFWACEVITIAMVIALGSVTWGSYRRLAKRLAEDRVSAGLNVLESRMHAWDAEVRSYRDKMEQQFQILLKVCEQARGILERERAQAAAQPASLEENELKLIVTDRLHREDVKSIPTLRQVEETKKRLKQEMALDLRSLLRDQLA